MPYPGTVLAIIGIFVRTGFSWLGRYVIIRDIRIPQGEYYMGTQKTVVIVGAGPGGLAAALSAREEGMAVTVFDPEPPGGNAYNHSLLPSKLLMAAAEVMTQGRQWGMHWDKTQWDQVMAYQAREIKRMNTLVKEALTPDIDYRKESARLVKGRRAPIAVQGTVSEEVVQGDIIILANGSRQRLLPGAKPDGNTIMIPRAFHTLTAIPARLAIIGAGATGLEAASLFARLGTEVHLYHSAPSLLPHYGPAIGRHLQTVLAHQGVTLHLARRVERLDVQGDQVWLTWGSPADPSKKGRKAAEKVFLATGRVPMWEPDTLADLGLAVDGQGFLVTGEYGQTSLDGVYALGDAAGGTTLLANRAMVSGRRAIAHALGRSPAPSPIVEAVYTHPEVARVGRTRGDRVYEAHWPYPLACRPLIEGAHEALIRVFADRQGRVCGGEAIGPHAADLMNVILTAMTAGLDVQALAGLGFASPTMAEVLYGLSPADESAPG